MGRTNEQKLAIKSRGNCLVSAGAGSGKTSVLTDRIVYNICSENASVNLDEILILTFANDAANEMRERLKSELGNKKETINLVPLVDSANICTFDAYFLYLVKKYCYKLGVSNDIQLVPDDIVYVKKNEILEDILLKHAKKAQEGSENDKALFLNYVRKNYKDLIDVIIEADKQFQDITDLDAYINHYKNDVLTDEGANKFLEEYIVKPLNTRINIAKQYLDLSGDTALKEKYYNKYPDLNNSSLSWRELISFFDSFGRIRSDKSITNKSALNKANDELSEAKSFFKNLNFDERMRVDFEFNKRIIPILLDILKEMRERITEFKYEKNAFTFNDIAMMAYKLLKENDDIRLSIKNKLKLIMIDEYQDTSIFQEEFINLISNNNVFVVGDVKQSIYAFRGANPDQFIAKYEKYKSGKDGQVIDMNTNFRSRVEISEDVNKIFSKIMTLKYGGADYKASHNIEHGSVWFENYGKTLNAHGVFALDYELPEGAKSEEDTEAQIDALIKNIKARLNSKMQVYDVKKKCLRDCTYKDFAILVSKSSLFKDVEKAFNEAGIPINAVYDEDIKSDSSVIVLINILKLINELNLDYKDQDEAVIKHSYISVIRSFLYSKSDDEIYQVILNDTYKEMDEFKFILDFAKKHKNKLVHEIYLDILNDFDFIDKLSLVGNVINKLKYNKIFFDRTICMDNFGYDLSDFISYLSSLDDLDVKMETRNTTDAENAVVLTTMHKSKGIQYKIVYLAFNNKKPKPGKDFSGFFIDKNFGIFLPSLVDPENKSFHSRFRNLFVTNKTPSELIRLLYVAITRAEEEVCILREKDSKENDELSVDEKYEAIESDGNEFDEFLESEEENRDLMIAKLEKIKIIQDVIDAYGPENLEVNPYQNVEAEANKINDVPLTSKAIKIVKPTYEFKELKGKIRASKVKSDLANASSLEYGTHLHLLLEGVDFKTKDCSFISNLKEREKIEKVLQNPIFNGLENATFYKEYEYYDDNKDMTGIIDLLIEKDDELLVIDYKTKNIDDKDYDTQLNIYREYVEKVFNKKAKCYLLSIMTNEVREVKNESN